MRRPILSAISTKPARVLRDTTNSEYGTNLRYYCPRPLSHLVPDATIHLSNDIVDMWDLFTEK